MVWLAIATALSVAIAGPAFAKEPTDSVTARAVAALSVDAPVLLAHHHFHRGYYGKRFYGRGYYGRRHFGRRYYGRRYGYRRGYYGRRFYGHRFKRRFKRRFRRGYYY